MINEELEEVLFLARYDMGLATVIGKTDRDANGRMISVAMHATMQRLRIWELKRHIHSSADRNLIQAFNELHILKDKLALPYAVIQKTAYIYRKARHKGLSRGRTTSGLFWPQPYMLHAEKWKLQEH